MAMVKFDPKRRQLLKIAAAASLSPLLDAHGRERMPALSGWTMGGTYYIRIGQNTRQSDLPKIRRRVERELELTEILMSTFRPQSELSRFNRNYHSEWQRLSPLTTKVLAAAMAVQDQSAGAFNPAIGNMVNHWGFGPGSPSSQNAVLTPAAIELEGFHARKSHPGGALDLNAIAKGDAVDRVGAVLGQFGVENFMIEVGGEILARGAGPGGDGWRVGIEGPSMELLATLSIDGMAVATSGSYVDFYELGGRTYSHLMDPRHGEPVRHDLSVVSVAAASAMEADAWSTALMVMGPEHGFAYALKNHMAAMIVGYDEAGEQWNLTTPEFDRLSAVQTRIS